MEFLRETDVAGHVKKAVCNGERVDIAVAFWGRGARDLLGLRRGANVRIICNLGHVGTNPAEIMDLFKEKIPIKTCDRLHAKVYNCNKFVIIGSSNASTNGLFDEDKDFKGWIEANVRSTNPELIADVDKFFDLLWNSSKTVSRNDIERARLLIKDFDRPASKKSGVFDACLSRPELFENYFVVAYDANRSPHADKVYCTEKDSIQKDGKFKISQIDAYELGEVRKHSVLIDLDLRTGAPETNGIFDVISDPIKVPENEYFVVVVSRSSLQLNENEKRFLKDNARIIFNKKSIYNNEVASLSDVLNKFNYAKSDI